MSSSAGPRSPARVLPGCRSFVEVRRRSSSIPPRSSRCPGRGARLCGVGGGGRVGGETQAHGGGGGGVSGGMQGWEAGRCHACSRGKTGEGRRKEGRKEKRLILILPKSPSLKERKIHLDLLETKPTAGREKKKKAQDVESTYIRRNGVYMYQDPRETEEKDKDEGWTEGGGQATGSHTDTLR